MGWTGEQHVQLGYPDDSADNTVEASIVSLAGGIIVAAGLDNDWYNVTFRAFRADGEGGLEGGPVASFNGYPDNLPTAANPNGTNGDPDGYHLAIDDMNKFVQISDYVFAWIGESSTDYLAVGSNVEGGDYMICAQFLTVDPETLEITRTGRAWADNNEFYADETTGVAWDGKLVMMTGSATGATTNYVAVCEPVGDTEVTFIPTPTDHERMGPLGISGDTLIYWDDDVPGWYKIDLNTEVGSLLTSDDMGMNYSWAWFTKTLADGRIAVIITGNVGADGVGDPLKLVVFDADMAGGYDGPYTIAASAKNVGWTGGWYSNVRSIDVFPNGNLLIGYLVGNNQPWLAEVDPDDGTIIRQYQPPHNTNITNCWNYEIATFKTNNTDFLLMWAGYSDAGWETYRLLVAGGGESFGHIAADPFQETFENGADGERITTFNTNFPGIDWDEDPFANDAEVYFTTDSHSGALAAVGEGYSLHYPYTLDEAVTISGDPESGTFWMKVDYSAFSTEEALFSIHTGQTGDQLVSANERLTLFVFNSESNLQWEDHSYDTPVLVPDDTWFKVEWSVEGPAYTIKITDEAENVYLDIAKDMDDDGLQSPYYKFAHVTFYLPPGVTLDDINNEAPPAPATAVWWWDGEALQPAEFLGWWASGTLEDAEIPGWWDGDTIEPLETE